MYNIEHFAGTARANPDSASTFAVPEVVMPIKVLLADDSELMRSAIRRTLQEEPRIELVGEASSFDKTMQMIADSKPHVLLLDLRLAEKRNLHPSS